MGYDDDQPSAESATIASQAFSTVDELAAEVERTYTGGAWVELLDAGYEHNADLYGAWVPEQIRHDFHGASIAARTWPSTPACSPAMRCRHRDAASGLETEARDQMAAHLVGLGSEVSTSGQRWMSMGQPIAAIGITGTFSVSSETLNDQGDECRGRGPKFRSAASRRLRADFKLSRRIRDKSPWSPGQSAL